MAHEIEAARLRRVDQMNRDIHLAWRVQQMKVLTKRKKSGKGFKVVLPKLEKFLIPDHVKKRQTVAQMRGVLEFLSQQTRFPLRTVQPRGK